jgi:glyoxylase-like metal-dependent hydrolase (beta-lactamase superfamily II)
MHLHRNEAEGVHRIEEAFTNWFIVEEGDRLTVVDAGFPRSWQTLHRVLGELGRAPGDIEAIVLTHAHFDHMGFVKRAREELRVPVYAHADEVSVAGHPWLFEHERARPAYLRHPSFVKTFTAMGAMGALWVQGTRDLLTYGDGAELDLPGRPRVVFTPGHSRGHCALHLPDRGVVLAGDAFVMLDPYTGMTGPKIVAGAATADSPRALASLDALAALDAGVALTGHGPPWRGELRAAAARAREIGAT